MSKSNCQTGISLPKCLCKALNPIDLFELDYPLTQSPWIRHGALTYNLTAKYAKLLTLKVRLATFQLSACLELTCALNF